MVNAARLFIGASVLVTASAYLPPVKPGSTLQKVCQSAADDTQPRSLGVPRWVSRLGYLLSPAAVVAISTGAFAPLPAWSEQSSTEFKIEKGAASTLNSGTVKTITRGVSIDQADFTGKNLAGVSFQQSLVRDGKFAGANLEGASFFDADLTGADFTGANMNQVNLELANLKDAVLTNAVVTEAYISGATRLTNIKIDGADFSGTLLRGDQKKALCAKATGTNPTTGVATADSLLCN